MWIRVLRAVGLLLVALAILGYGSGASAAFDVDAFPAQGSGGRNRGQTFNFGQNTSYVWEIDSLFDIDGQDLNDDTQGTAAQMGLHDLPEGVDFTFSSELSDDSTDILLTYTWTNNTGSTLHDITLLSFVDADVLADFQDDTAAVVGAPGAGESFEVDVRSQIVPDLFLAALDGANAATDPSDVVMAMSFAFVDFVDRQSAILRVQLSDDGDFLSDASFHIVQSDAGPDALTYSGVAVLGFVVDPFPASGSGGSDRNHTIFFGQGGEVFQVDSLLAVEGQDLNGAPDGIAAQMGADALPQGLDFAFASELSSDTTDLTLTYTWTNNTGAALNDVTLLSFVDTDIFPTLGNDMAAVVGAPASSESFEINTGAAIFPDVLAAQLDGNNAGTDPIDVAMSTSFQVGTIGTGQSATMQVQLSADGDSLADASFHIVQSDPGPDTLTYSATAVPEPGQTALLAAALLGLSALARRRARRSPHPKHGPSSPLAAHMLYG